MAGWRGLESAVKAGKVRAIGLSNFDLNEERFDDIITNAEIQPEIVQIELHPYAQRKAFRKKCAENHIRQNITVLDFSLTDDDMNRIRALDAERRFYTGTFESSQRFLDWKPED